MHKNSFYLLVSQGIMMLSGYLFWIFVARKFSSHDVGIASALISIATLISQISILGFNNALIRFLPTSDQKNAKINTSLLVTSVAAIVIAGIYLLGLAFFSPKLLFLRDNLLAISFFISSMVLVTLNTFTDSVFLAYQATKYNMIIYGSYGLLRMVLPFGLLAFGAMGIFGAHMAGIALAVALSFYFMAKSFAWRPSLRFRPDILKLIGGYSLANYVAGFFWGLPLLVAPLLAVNHLGASAAAHLYMVMMIINALLVIPTVTSQTLFAAGSQAHSQGIRAIATRSLRMALTLEVVAVIGVLALGKLVIGIFGAEYASGGAGVLAILAVSCLVVVGSSTGNVILKLQRRNLALIVVNIIGALATIGLFLPLMSRFGLNGIGFGFAAGQLLQLGLLTAAIYFPKVRS